MTEDDVIADVFVREGDEYGDETTPRPIDQPTGRGGITLPTLQAYFDAVEPPRRGTVLDLKTLTRTQAETVVRWTLARTSHQNGFDLIAFEPLKLQMIDFAYNSGEGLAMRWLQRVLRVPRTSRMDAPTVAALGRSDPWLVHQALIGARLQMIDMATDPGGKIDKKYEEGLEKRAHKFSLLDVP